MENKKNEALTLIEPVKEQRHQLNALPPLAPENAIYNNPILTIVCLYILSVLGVIFVCRHHADYVPVATTFITVGTTFFTIAVGAIGADKVARKGIYAIAANKNGITETPIVKAEEVEKLIRPVIPPQ